MRIVAVCALLLAGCLLAPSTAGAIQLDRGIAGARLGNMKAEVEAALGQPNRVRNGTTTSGRLPCTSTAAESA
jgi:hypothetical protein